LDYFSVGAQKLAPLPVRKAFVWDAGIPLRMIRDRPHPKQFLTAAKEAVFLLLMATGCRVDDLLKMGMEFRWENGVFVIPFLKPRKSKVNGQWTLTQRLAPYTGSDRICPVSAILLYSTFAVAVQKPGEKFLFVSSTGKKAAKATLRRWVGDILLEAGIKAPAGSCRSAATSGAHIREIPIDAILRSAGWSLSLMFFKHYQREVDSAFVGTNLLPPL
jgi:integrase